MSVKKVVVLFCVCASLASGCASDGGGVSRLEAAKMQDEMAQQRTARYRKANGPVWELTCARNPSQCQRDPNYYQNQVPPERANDRGFWQDFSGRLHDLGK